MDPDYAPSRSDLEAIVGFVREALTRSLDPRFRLIDVEDARRGLRAIAAAGRRLAELAMPLKVAVEGPEDLEMESLAYVLQALEDEEEWLAERIASLNRNSFGAVEVEAGPGATFGDPGERDFTVETLHFVRFILDGTPYGYRLSQVNRAACIRFVKDLIEKNAGGSLELVRVAYAGVGDDDGRTLPLEITVKGPAGEADFALAHVLEVLEGEHAGDLAMYLKSLDWNAFKDVDLSVALARDPSDCEIAKGSCKTTVHLVQLILDDVPDGHRISRDDRAFCILYVKDVMEDNIRGSLELVDVAYAGGGDDGRALPLKITVNGPRDETDFALAHVMEVLEDQDMGDLGASLKSLDSQAYKDVSLSVAAYDPNTPNDYSEDSDDSISFPNPEDFFDEPEPPIEMERTKHPVLLTFGGVSSGYRLRPADRASIIRYVEELMEDDLHESLKLIKVAYGGDDGDRRNLLPSTSSRRLGDLRLPLMVTVEGPADEADFALSYIMEVLDDHEEDIARKLKSLDWDAFKDVVPSTGVYDPDDEETFVNEPEPVATERTEHPVKLTLRNLPSGYRLSPANRAAIIHYVKKLMKDNLDESLQLIRLVYGGGDRARSLLLSSSSTPGLSRRLGDLSLPLLVTVDGPEDETDFALSYIMEVLEDHEQDIMRKLKSLDWNAFVNAGLSTGTYDPDDPDTFLDEPEPDPEPEPEPEPKPEPTPEPTPKPVRLEQTEHPVQLVLKDVPPGYRLNAANQASMIRYVKVLLEDNLDESLDLIEVAYAGRDRTRSLLSSTLHRTRRLDVLPLPLRVAVKGPANEVDFALSHIMDVLEDHEDDITRKLKSLDWEAFKDVAVSTDTFDFNDVPEPPPEVKMRTTEHLVQLALDDVPPGYRFSAKDKASVLRFVKELLEEKMDDRFQLVRVAYADGKRSANVEGMTRGDSEPPGGNPSSLASAHSKNKNGRSLFSSRRLDSISLPLQVTVKGPDDESDYALSYVMDALDDNMEDLVRKFQSLNWDDFKDVGISTASYDPDSAPESGTARAETTEHPVRVSFKNIVPGYRLSPANRKSVIRFVKEVMQDNLDTSLDLVKVAYAGRDSDVRADSKQRGNKDPASSSPSSLESAHKNKNEHVDGKQRSDGKPAIASSQNSLESSHKKKDGRNLLSSRWLNKISSRIQITGEGPEEIGHAHSLLSLTRRLETMYLPLLVTVRGPAGEADFASSHVRKILDNHEREIELYLRMLDGEAFMVDDNSDSRDPETMGDGGENTPWWAVPWWIWLLVGIGVLFVSCCLCICCICLRKRKQIKDEKRRRECDVLEKVVEEEAAFIGGPVAYPEPQPNMLLPYQSHYKTTAMVPFDPAMGQNSTALVHYDPRQLDDGGREIVPFQEAESSSEESSSDSETATTNSSKLLMADVYRSLEAQRKIDSMLVLYEHDSSEGESEANTVLRLLPPSEPSGKEATKQQKTPRSIRATGSRDLESLRSRATSSRQHEPLQIREAPSRKHKPLQIRDAPSRHEEPLQIRDAPSHQHKPLQIRAAKKSGRAKMPKSVGSSSKRGIDPAERRRSARLMYEAASRGTTSFATVEEEEPLELFSDPGSVYRAPKKPSRYLPSGARSRKTPPTGEDQLQLYEDPRPAKEQESLQLNEDPSVYNDGRYYFDEDSDDETCATQPPTQKEAKMARLSQGFSHWDDDEPPGFSSNIV